MSLMVYIIAIQSIHNEFFNYYILSFLNPKTL